MPSTPPKENLRNAHRVSMLPSPTVSIYPAVCRICHSSEASVPYNGVTPGEPLISPCNCNSKTYSYKFHRMHLEWPFNLVLWMVSVLLNNFYTCCRHGSIIYMRGTMGLYHRSCLERWLTTSRRTCCEICKFAFQIRYQYPSFCSFVRQTECRRERCNFFTDIACFVFLTPLAIGCVMLCYTGVNQQTKEFTEWHFDNAGLIFLGSMLSFTYIMWLLITANFHLKVYLDWRKEHKKLYVVDQLSERESFLVNGPNNNKTHSRCPFLVSSLNCAYCVSTPVVSTTRSVPGDSQQMNATENAALIDAIIATPENNADGEEVVSVERARSQDDYEEIEAMVENQSESANEHDWDETPLTGVSMSTSSGRFMASTPLRSGTLSRIPLFNFNGACATLEENNGSMQYTSVV